MAAIYSDIVFKRLMNSSYFPLQSMQRSVDKIRAEKGDGFLANIKWGEYQLIPHPTVISPRTRLTSSVSACISAI
jgi:hypothetical protein